MFLQKSLPFLRTALDAAQSPGYVSSASSNPPLIKDKESYWCYFSSWFFYWSPM